MDFGDASIWLLIPLQILFVDLLLGADNALVIALACRSLPPEEMRRAALLGVGGAILARLLMTTLATWLLAVPFLQIFGALVLILIAMNLCVDDDGPAKPRSANDLWSAAAIIVVADAAMGLDNVVALAAIARGNFWLLAIGVAFSVPILGLGGIFLSQWLARAPALVAFGAAMLGWIAGDMALADPVIAPWANANAPGLVAIAPALGAAFVYFYGRMVQREAPASAEKRAPLPASPVPRKRPAPPARLAPFGDRTPEPIARVEPPKIPATRENRVAIIGVLLLAVAAGAILMIASLIDSYN